VVEASEGLQAQAGRNVQDARAEVCQDAVMPSVGPVGLHPRPHPGRHPA